MDLESRIARLERLIGGNGVKGADGTALTGEEALAYLDQLELSAFGGITNTQTVLGEVVASTATAVEAAGAPPEAVQFLQGLFPPGA